MHHQIGQHRERLGRQRQQDLVAPQALRGGGQTKGAKTPLASSRHPLPPFWRPSDQGWLSFPSDGLVTLGEHDRVPSPIRQHCTIEERAAIVLGENLPDQKLTKN